MSASSSTPLLTVFWDELLFTGCWVFGWWQKVSKTKFFADASRIVSAYILKASTENFAKVQYLKARTEVMMDPITSQLKERWLWNCWCCLRWRGWRMIRMRNSDQHSRGCQWFPWSLRLLGWLGWPEHHIYVEQIKAWWISSVQTSRSHSLISQLGNSLISTIFCGLMSRWAMFLKMWQVQGLIKICRHIMQR